MDLELRRVLVEATDALARLDSDALEELERRAVKLQALIVGGVSAMALSEIAARHRVFAAVVEATGENLRVMRRISGDTSYGSPRPENPWGR